MRGGLATALMTTSARLITKLKEVARNSVAHMIFVSSIAVSLLACVLSTLTPHCFCLAAGLQLPAKARSVY